MPSATAPVRGAPSRINDRSSPQLPHYLTLFVTSRRGFGSAP